MVIAISGVGEAGHPEILIVPLYFCPVHYDNCLLPAIIPTNLQYSKSSNMVLIRFLITATMATPKYDTQYVKIYYVIVTLNIRISKPRASWNCRDRNIEYLFWYIYAFSRPCGPLPSTPLTSKKINRLNVQLFSRSLMHFSIWMVIIECIISKVAWRCPSVKIWSIWKLQWRDRDTP